MINIKCKWKIRKKIISLFIVILTLMISFILINTDNISVGDEIIGTKDNPYQITNCEELNWTRDDLDAYYILMNDIDLAECGVQNWNDGEGFMPIGDDGACVLEDTIYNGENSYEDVYGDGNYIYIANWGEGIRAYSFDGSDLTLRGTRSDYGLYYRVWCDGSYIYTTHHGNGVSAYTFDGANFIFKDNQDDGGADAVWGDGTYIYCVDSDGIYAYTFNGVTFVLKDIQHDGGYYREVWGDGTYIYVACDDNGILAYTFDGTSFTLVGNRDDGNDYMYVWGDGTYIYVSCLSYGVRAYAFDGSDFTLLDTQDDGDSYYGVWGDGTYIYTACNDDGFRVYTFDGANFILRNTQDDGSGYVGVWGDGTYIYTVCAEYGLRAYLCSDYPFSGGFDGQNHTINHLFINNTSLDHQGLFGYMTSANISNVILDNVNISGGNYIGGLCGYAVACNILNCHIGIENISHGDLECTDTYGSGGLIGYGKDGTVIINCSSYDGVIYNGEGMGGLVGGFYSNCLVYNSFSSVCIYGGRELGGFIADVKDSIVINCYSIGDVILIDDTFDLDDYFFGGFGGFGNNAVINNSYSTGYVYPIGLNIGGFWSGASYSCSFNNCYWDNETSGQTTSDGGTGRTTAQMTYDYVGYDPPCVGLYEDWDLDTNASGSSIWVHDDTGQNDGYPLFRWQYVEESEPPWSNVCPIASGEHPTNNSIDQVLQLAIGCTVEDGNLNHTLNVTFATNVTGSWVNMQTNHTSSYTDTVNWTYTQANTGNTNYWWCIYVHDGICNQSFTYSFKTASNFSVGDGTPGNPYQITNCEELNWTRDDLDAYYILMNDIDLAACGVTDWNGGAGFIPIGDDTNQFTGNFNGQNYNISNIYIDSSSYIGLFGYALGAEIYNISLFTPQITGDSYVGSLAGFAMNCTITNCHIQECTVEGGNDYVGGLIGCLSSDSIVINCSIYGNSGVIGDDYVGGLIGYSICNQGMTLFPYVCSSFSTADVDGDCYIGGLVGCFIFSYDFNSYATGNVSASGYGAGGLIGTYYDSVPAFGYNKFGSLNNSYSIGEVAGEGDYVGGLIGWTYTYNIWGYEVPAYGYNITDCYWDNETSNQIIGIGNGTSENVTGKTTAQMTYDYVGYDPPCVGLYEDWDLNTNASGSSIWVHDDTGQNDGYPLFRWQYVEESEPPWSNVCPIASGEQPSNNSVNIGLSPAVGATITDGNSNHTMNCTFATNVSGDWVNQQTNTSVANNSAVNWTYTQANTELTHYFWRVYVHDGFSNQSFTYSFITQATPEEGGSVVSGGGGGAYIPPEEDTMKLEVPASTTKTEFDTIAIIGGLMLIFAVMIIFLLRRKEDE